VQLADRIASYIVIGILVVATGVAAYWYATMPERAFVITLSVLVVTCPCALALATPAAFAAAGTRLAELRLLLTNGNAIEALARATRIVFDKTGTLTEGRPVVVATKVRDTAYTEDECRQIAAALEAASTHPIAAAFALEDARHSATDQRIVVGEGVAGTIDGRRWRIGSEDFVAPGRRSHGEAGDSVAPGRRSDAEGADLVAPGRRSDGGRGVSPRSDEGHSTIYLGTEGRTVASFTLDDKLREDAHDVLERIRALGPKIALASGDTEPAVRRVAAALGIDDFRARCRPEDKLDYLRDCQRRGDAVIMVGDGINDAPVLAGADASVAMAEGALLAQTSADLIMLGHSLRPLVTSLETARRTMRIVRQNLAWAIVYNVTAVPLAALGYVPPWAAAIGMSASSLIVVLNALRLSRYGEV
jgi:Cu2+-exporting ATPase